VQRSNAIAVNPDDVPRGTYAKRRGTLCIGKVNSRKNAIVQEKSMLVTESIEVVSDNLAARIDPRHVGRSSVGKVNGSKLPITKEESVLNPIRARVPSHDAPRGRDSRCLCVYGARKIE